jgi:predicted HicB family RNase H-like nuclease
MPQNQTTHLRSTQHSWNGPVAFTVRFNEDLRQRLANAANRSVRSINSEIIFRLRSSFEQDETKKMAAQ